MLCRYFFPFYILSFYFVNGFFCYTEAFYFGVVAQVYFLSCCLFFRCQIQKFITKTHVKGLYLCFLLRVLWFQVLHSSLMHFKLIVVSGVKFNLLK